MEPGGTPEWPGPYRPQRRTGLKHTGVAAIIFLLFIITLVFAGAYFGRELDLIPSTTSGQSHPARPGVVPFGQRQEPPPGYEESASPLSSPPPRTRNSSSYKFLAVKADGSPLSYSPCRPIHYVINENEAPMGSRTMLEEAIQRISYASGLRFVFDGTTDELPSDDRPGYQPAQYGDRWAPVLIAWTSPQVVPRLSGQTIGLGGSSSIALNNGFKAYVTGTVSLDAPQFGEVLAERSGRAIATSVILHELGHLVGLDHVDDPSQLMYDEASRVRDFADGDLAGLARLGTGPCSRSF